MHTYIPNGEDDGPYSIILERVPPDSYDTPEIVSMLAKVKQFVQKSIFVCCMLVIELYVCVRHLRHPRKVTFDNALLEKAYLSTVWSLRHIRIKRAN